MNETKIKAITTSIWSLVVSFFGVLAVPVLLLVLCNVIDYGTGLVAAKYRAQELDSYKGFRGIAKKVSMWLLVAVGAIIDQLIIYASETIGLTMPFTFLIACVVAVWLVCNELISILENIKDIGVPLPPFLMGLVSRLKSQVEDKADMYSASDEEGESDD